MSVVRVALVALAAVAIASGLLIVLAGDVFRGVAVAGSSIGPLWLQRHLAQRGRVTDR